MILNFLCAFAVSLPASAALAQSPGGSGRGSILNKPQPLGQPPDPQRPVINENPVEMLEYRLGQLYADLKLTQAQEKGWNAYAERLRALVSDIVRERERAFANSTLNSVKQLEQATDTLRNRLTALEDISAAARTLYDSLTPEQKIAADPRLANFVRLAMASGAASPAATASAPPANAATPTVR